MTTLKLNFRTTASVLFLSILFIFATACGGDDDGDIQEEEQQMEEEAQQEEQTVLNPNEVINGLIIENSTLINGNAPQANGVVSLNPVNTSTALQNEGFEIELNSLDDISGVYLIIENTDGQPADSYLDIPLSQPFTSETNPKKGIFGRQNSNNQRPLSALLNIGFDASIPVGIFCYSICVYDSNGNISLPQQVCVTVQSWGGNINAAGNWQLTRYQENYDGMNVDVGLNQQYCFPETLFCNNGGTVNTEYCSTWDYFNFDMSADGTYSISIRELDTDPDYEQTTSTCTEVIVSGYYEYTSTGQWAFNDSDNRLVLVEYGFEYDENGETDSGTYGTGNGEVVFDDPVNINGNNMILTIDDFDDELIIYTFEK